MTAAVQRHRHGRFEHTHPQSGPHRHLGLRVRLSAGRAERPRADPLVGMAITAVIFKITWNSWRLISTTEPGDVGRHDH